MQHALTGTLKAGRPCTIHDFGPELRERRAMVTLEEAQRSRLDIGEHDIAYVSRQFSKPSWRRCGSIVLQQKQTATRVTGISFTRSAFRYNLAPSFMAPSIPAKVQTEIATRDGIFIFFARVCPQSSGIRGTMNGFYRSVEPVLPSRLSTKPFAFRRWLTVSRQTRWRQPEGCEDPH